MAPRGAIGGRSRARSKRRYALLGQFWASCYGKPRACVAVLPRVKQPPPAGQSGRMAADYMILVKEPMQRAEAAPLSAERPHGERRIISISC